MPAAAAETGAAPRIDSEKVAVVRLRLRVDGKVVRAPVRAVPWGEQATFTVDAAGHHHVIVVTPDAFENGAMVALSYERDGKKVTASTNRRVELRHATPVFADDEAAIAVTIIPIRVEID
jgi:hypothetical protein